MYEWIHLALVFVFGLFYYVLVDWSKGKGRLHTFVRGMLMGLTFAGFLNFVNLFLKTYVSLGWYLHGGQ